MLIACQDYRRRKHEHVDGWPGVVRQHRTPETARTHATRLIRSHLPQASSHALMCCKRRRVRHAASFRLHQWRRFTLLKLLRRYWGRLGNVLRDRPRYASSEGR